MTGSKFHLQVGGKSFLVDCGLFQGHKELRERNWQALPFQPAGLEALLLTHAHIDHSGYIPRLVRDGFKGPIYCSEATADLCAILLPDSGHIQEDDAASANRYGFARHQPALPLYTEADARTALTFFRPVAFGQPHMMTDELRFTLSRAGHILGASFIHVTAGDGTSVLFTGDIGRQNSPVMKPPARLQEAEYIVLEATYGDRLHQGEEPTGQIGEVVRRTVGRGGTLIVPAFAVGRTQDILYHLWVLKSTKRIPDVPVFLDSPMAIDATQLLLKHRNEHRLSAQECSSVCAVARYARSVDESKAINASTMPKIILSASGMATGGRVLHHLKHYLGDFRNTVLLVGYQSPGTRGDRLARGDTTLKIHGHDWPVRAEIVQLDTLSAHADYAEILSWLRNFRSPPRKLFITHGEPAAAQALQQKIIHTFGWDAIVPRYGQSEEL
ncbi:MAG: MBL fold metallo-hydrolase RNA specificity domain-containing protein [Hyphomicrobiaceae bacterium]